MSLRNQNEFAQIEKKNLTADLFHTVLTKWDLVSTPMLHAIPQPYHSFPGSNTKEMTVVVSSCGFV